MIVRPKVSGAPVPAPYLSILTDKTVPPKLLGRVRLEAIHHTFQRRGIGSDDVDVVRPNVDGY